MAQAKTAHRPRPMLPKEFDDLSIWQHEWGLESEQQRFLKRIGSTLSSLQSFYDAMLERMPAIMAHLACLQPRELTLEDEELVKLAFSYVEISRCYEAWGQVDVRADFFKPQYLHTNG